MSKIDLPQSSAGINRYFDDYKSKINIKPSTILLFTLALIVVMLTLHGAFS